MILVVCLFVQYRNIDYDKVYELYKSLSSLIPSSQIDSRKFVEPYREYYANVIY